MSTPTVALSFETFPPKSLDASFHLWDTVQALAPLSPRFVSVTYGAGGSTQSLTQAAAQTLRKTSGMPVAAHLTCTGQSRDEVLATAQRYADSGVKDMVRRALLPWLNAFKFLNTYAEIDNWQPAENPPPSDNIMDQWILSRLQTLKSNIATEMEAYRLYNVVPALFEFIEELSHFFGVHM